MSNTKKPRKPTKETHKTSRKKQNHNHHHQQQQQQLPSWAVTMRSILSCKQLEVAQPQPLQQQQQQLVAQLKQKHKPTLTDETTKKTKKMRCSGSLCNNTKVMHKLEQQQQQQQQISNNANNVINVNDNSNGIVPKSSSSTSSVANNGNISIKGMPFRRLTGCYECRMVVDPVLAFTKDPSLRATICSCPHCGDIFMKPDHLELHQAVRHAVSELGREDTGKNIVEIIFQSSWLRKQNTICQIDRILKVNNTQRTINKFEEYRDGIKSKAIKLPKKHPRCIADGNELLRFHCTTFMCSLGLNGSSNLCNSIPHCGVCSIIKGGFKPTVEGVLTTATSGRAHDRAEVGSGEPEKRAMLVCRVIAGRVRKSLEGGEEEEYDSVAGVSGIYSNLEELYVFNPRAILPCFVVVYSEF